MFNWANDRYTELSQFEIDMTNISLPKHYDMYDAESRESEEMVGKRRAVTHETLA